MSSKLFPTRLWLPAALLAATFLSLLVTTQNYITLTSAGASVSWGHMLLLELPVWYSWVALLPVIDWLARRFPPTGRRRWVNLLVHFIAGLLLVLVSLVLATVVRSPLEELPEGLTFWPLVGLLYLRYFALFLIVYGGLVTTVIAWRYHLEAQARAVRESRLAAQLARARLDVLRAQIHPHFLFNTLHSISGLMTQDVRAARRMISRLGELLRLSLEEPESHEVTLEEEVGFLDRYADIQRMRFGDRLDVDYRIAPDALGCAVPRLLLQPLVENAVEHGVGRRSGPSRVQVAGRRSGPALEIEVTDDGPGFESTDLDAFTGVGLRNTRSRLEQLYGDAARLELGEGPDGGGLVRVVLPAHALERDRS